MTINLPFSIDSDREALLDPQAAYLENYRKELETALGKLADEAIDRWLKDSDREFRNAVKKALDQATELAAIELRTIFTNQGTDDAFGSILSGFSGAASSANGSSGADQLTGAIANIAVTAVTDALFGGSSSTRVRSAETDRSREEESRYRQSRSQQQASAAREANKGQRNL